MEELESTTNQHKHCVRLEMSEIYLLDLKRYYLKKTLKMLKYKVIYYMRGYKWDIYMDQRKYGIENTSKTK